MMILTCRALSVALLVFCLNPSLAMAAGPVNAKSQPSPAAAARNTAYQSAIALANAGKFAEAIPKLQALYDQNPTDPKIRRNLQTLYYNAAAQAYQQEQLGLALNYAEGGRKLAPDDIGLKQLTGVLYFQKGKALLEEQEDYAGALGLMNKALALNPAETAIKRGMAGVYLQWAQSLKANVSGDGPADTSAVLAKANEALKLTPDDPAVKRSVANLNLNLATETKDKAQQKAYLDAALATDPSEEIKQAAARIAGQGNPLATLKAMNPLGTKPSNPANTAAPLHPFLEGGTQRQSAQQQLGQLSHSLNTPLAEGAPLEQSLAALETAYYGATQTGSIQGRLNALFEAVQGSNGSLVDVPDYLKDVLAVTGGKVTRFRVMPVRVYVEAPRPDAIDPKTRRPLVPEATRQAIAQGLGVWRKSTLGYVDTTWVTQPEQADIHIVWSDQPWHSGYDPEAQTKARQQYTLLKNMQPSKLGKVLKTAGMFAPGYFGILPQVGAVAADYHLIQAAGFLRKEGTITLPRAWAITEQASDRQRLTNVMVVETGRILGLKAVAPSGVEADGLSLTRQNPLTATGLLQPSRPDLATLRALYLRPVDLPVDVH